MSKPSVTSHVVAIVLSFAAMPVTVYLTACTLAWTWSRLAVESLGAGPSLPAWFGITSMLAIVKIGPGVMKLGAPKPEENDPDYHPIALAAMRTAAHLIALGGSVLVIRLACWMIGW